MIGNIVFCATSRSGLGHLRRIRNIAEPLRAARPDTVMELVTNSAAGVTAERRDALYDSVIEVTRSEMASWLDRRGPDVVVVDTAVIPGIHRLSARLALVLREVRPELLERFHLSGGRLWDLVVAPHPDEEWSPGTTFPARRVHHSGWIHGDAVRDPGSRSPRRSGTPEVLVVSGGGGTDATARGFAETADAVLGGIRDAGTPVHVTRIRGARASRTPALRHANRTLDPVDDLPVRFAEADLVISACGYNSILELAVTTTPTLLVPVDRTYDDQERRAERWGPQLGLAHDPTRAGRSVDWAARVLGERRRRLAIPVPSGGADAAAVVGGLL